jgi:hypothetical protein
MEKPKHFIIGDILSFRNSIVIFKEFSSIKDTFKCVCSYSPFVGLTILDDREYKTKLYNRAKYNKEEIINLSIKLAGMRYQDGKMVSVRPDTYMHYIDEFGDYVIVRKDDGRDGISVRNGIIKRPIDECYIQFAKGALLPISNYNCEITLDAFNLWIKMVGYKYDSSHNKFNKL